MCPDHTSEARGRDQKATLPFKAWKARSRERVTFPLCSHLFRKLRLIPVITTHPAMIPNAGRASGHIFRDTAAAYAFVDFSQTHFSVFSVDSSLGT